MDAAAPERDGEGDRADLVPTTRRQSDDDQASRPRSAGEVEERRQASLDRGAGQMLGGDIDPAVGPRGTRAATAGRTMSSITASNEPREKKSSSTASMATAS